jgi:16S rRNA (cytosine967-C5)-methyltransferase
VSRFHSYINSAKQILSVYKGQEPLSSFLKKYFAANKKFGSKDRREVSSLCYSFFRAGKLALDLSLEERLLTGKFLCSSAPDEILQELKSEWNHMTGMNVTEKLKIAGAESKDIFPWQNELSEGIDPERFAESFFTQPDLFLRIRPGHEEKVLFKLKDDRIDYEFISPCTIRLPNNFNADKYFELDKEVVVQDYNSQKVMTFIPVRPGRSDRVWDCCAGSGGKSVMAYDLNPEIELTVSDVRESILANLTKRFERAGIKKYKSFIADITHSPLTIHHSPFDLIIADVPCTGSGTWGRTPEQLFYFDEKKIDEYGSMQKNIVSNVFAKLQPGGYLLYITCSVFKKENEEVVNYIKEKFHLQVLRMELLRGYELKADIMFVSLLQKNL